MIKETFLYFIWKLQYFHKQNLSTTQGERVQIFHTGILNSDSGPDFTNARVRIGEIEWYGNIEVHINSSDWQLHNHQHDEAYNNVILHVVWNDDAPVRRDTGTLIPTLELRQRIPEKTILKYSSIINNKEVIPCSAHFNSVSALKKISMIDRMLVERLETKRTFIKELVHRNKGDWQESAYQLLARNFGFKLNSEPFLRLAYSIPLKSLLWHRKSLLQLEAMLFGQAGLLEEKFKDEYPALLKKEYAFLSRKFHNTVLPLNKSEWKFLRIRPANFPTIRIAEFASFMYVCPDFFKSITALKSVKEIHKAFNAAVLSDYWSDHYRFDKKTDRRKRVQIGSDSVDTIIINTVVPFLYCLGKEKDNELYVERALRFLEEMNPEKNKITRLWEQAGMKMENSYDSQGAIELHNHYCTKKNCLNCEIGASILNEKEISAALSKLTF